MERSIISQLFKWKNNPNRKPLILEGARQIGKTWVLKHFGQKYFREVFYFNFEEQKTIHTIFSRTKNPKRIVEELGIYTNQKIDIDQSLIIFDEIQACPEALTSLKYFQENMPAAFVCAAGSLLGIYLTESFPVGKVNFLSMYPMTFAEFLQAMNQSLLLEAFHNADYSEFVHEKLWEIFKFYLICGGLPEVVESFVTNYQIDLNMAYQKVRDLQKELLKAYLADMAKHSGKVNSMHIERTWLSAAIQLSRKIDFSAPKFVFKGVLPGKVGYRELANPISWLEKAGLLIRVPIVNSSQHPLKAFTSENEFKLFHFDVGILGAMMELEPTILHQYDFKTYKGFFVENFVVCELKSHGASLYSWVEKSAEVEFLLQSRIGIIPIEVKSGAQTKAKSLKVYQQKYSPYKSIVLSGLMQKKSDDREYWPIYAVEKVLQNLE